MHEEIGVTVSSYLLLRTIYVVTSWAGEPENVSDEHNQIRWFDVGALKNLSNLAGTGYPELAALAWAEAAND